jgi:Sap, sulfolipid-1-addressing protein
VRVALLEIFLLAVGSMFWPLLLVVVVIALESSRPAKILVWFYLGGFITAVSVGAALVFLLQDSPLMTSRTRLPAGPWVDIVFGSFALAIGFALRRAHGRRERNRPRREAAVKRSRTKDRLQTLVEHGGPLAFAGGAVGSSVPGPLVIIGMAQIAQLGYSTIATLVVILAFFVIVFTFIEVPIGGFLVAPERTKAATVIVKAWLDRNLLLLAAWALTLVGAGEVVRGIVAALR